MNDSFLSIVQNHHDKDSLLVRARSPKDITRVFPNATTFQDDFADYRYRAFIPRQEVSKAISERIDQINYGNFKDSVKERQRHDAYLNVWSVMADVQEDGGIR